MIRRDRSIENNKSSKEIMNYADEMFDVFSKSHSVLSSFVEINQEQREYFKKKFTVLFFFGNAQKTMMRGHETLFQFRPT